MRTIDGLRKASPLERIRVEPDDRSELVEGKWSGVDMHACSMILAALDSGVKAETAHSMPPISCFGCTHCTNPVRPTRKP